MDNDRPKVIIEEASKMTEEQYAYLEERREKQIRADERAKIRDWIDRNRMLVGGGGEFLQAVYVITVPDLLGFLDSLDTPSKGEK